MKDKEQDKKKIREAFQKKEKARLYIPILKDRSIYEDFIIELLDLLSAYFEPLKYGFGKQDILEFLTLDRFINFDLFTFLRFRRFIATDEDIEELFIKYIKMDKDYKSNEYYRGYEMVIKKESYLSDEEMEIYIAETIKKICYSNINKTDNLKEIYYSPITNKISYIKLV